MNRLAMTLMSALLLCSTANGKPPPARDRAAWEVFFSPRAGCTRAVLREIEHARKSIYVQAYSFTSRKIARALIAAWKRGVTVETILDRSNEDSDRSAASTLTEAGLAVEIDAAHRIAHNKLMIIDGETVVTGSFNFSKAARNNAENLLVLRSRTLAARYRANWQTHRAHSERLAD